MRVGPDFPPRVEDVESGTMIQSGTLNSGTKGMFPVPLAEGTCYKLFVGGGIWSEHISWSFGSLSGGGGDETLYFVYNGGGEFHGGTGACPTFTPTVVPAPTSPTNPTDVPSASPPPTPSVLSVIEFGELYQVVSSKGATDVQIGCALINFTASIEILRTMRIWSSSNAVLSGQLLNGFRLFNVRFGGSLSLVNLTLREGNAEIGAALAVFGGSSAHVFGCVRFR